jgi:3-oxoacyl-[acyl-carrier protein] reductase
MEQEERLVVQLPPPAPAKYEGLPYRSQTRKVRGHNNMAAGGAAEATQLDALDEQAVAKHADEIVTKAGRIEVSFNFISVLTSKASLWLNLDDFALPVTNGARTHFLTATAAARHMSKKNSGVILMMTATPGRVGRPPVGAFGAACAAIEAFARTLPAEVGPRGFRVVRLGHPDNRGKATPHAISNDTPRLGD